MTNQNRLKLAKTILAGATFAGVLGQVTPTEAFWSSDADTIFNSYNNAFYVSSGGNAIYKMDNGTGTGPGWWSFAEEIEMAEDAYGRTLSTQDMNIVSALCNGFINAYGTSWTGNAYNDDITWAVLAFARAYQITGNTTFRDCAKNNFDAMYSRAYDTNLGGGLWWNTSKGSKNACVNGPASIAAYMIYQIYGDSSYLTKAQSLYNWEKSTLYNTSTGQVYDNISSGGTVTTWVFSYNQGTFIGAADNLGDTNNAIAAANCTKNTLCTGGVLLPDSTENSDGAGFNGIFLRWMVKFMNNRGLQNTYLPWLQQNADAAWNIRRTSDNLSWCNWDSATPTTGTRYSFGCANSVIAMQLVPADGAGIIFYQDANYGGAPGRLMGSGSYTTSQLSALGVPDNWASSLHVPTGWQVTMYQNDNFTGSNWVFTSDSSYVGAAANDQMSSCKVQTTSVFFYQDANYLGSSSQPIGKGSYTLSQLQALGVSNDWMSSMRVPPGWTVTVYQNDNFGGTSWTFTSDSSYVGATVNDQMSSCVIQ